MYFYCSHVHLWKYHKKIQNVSPMYKKINMPSVRKTPFRVFSAMLE